MLKRHLTPVKSIELLMNFCKVFMTAACLLSPKSFFLHSTNINLRNL